MGVDVFFVISGYLITSIILENINKGNFSFLVFYSRRIRRIFPALFVMMATSYALAFMLLRPAAMKEFSGALAASTGFVANVYLLGVSGYFATAAELKPLLHHWSLSVEEQFYLLFPAMLLLTRRLGTKVQAGLFAFVALVSLGFAQWQVVHGQAAAAFFLLPTRIYELLIGVLAAYWLASAQGQALLLGGRLRHASILGLALILLAVFTFDASTDFPGFTALLPCLGAALIIIFAVPQGLVGAVLGWRPFVFVGLVSYSLYLWHYPLLAFTRIASETDSLPLLLCVCVVSFLVACLSWRYVERPVREMRAVPPLKLFGAAALCMVLLGGLGIAGYASDGFLAHYIGHQLDPETRANYLAYSPQAQPVDIPDEGCSFASPKLDAAFVARFEACARQYGKALLVLGDSHAGSIYGALRASGRTPFLVALWRGGCRPYDPKKFCDYHKVGPFLTEHGASVSQVVLQISGSHLIIDHLGKEYLKNRVNLDETAIIDVKNIRGTADYLATLPKGPDIIWLGPYVDGGVDLDVPKNFNPALLKINPIAIKIFSNLDEKITEEMRNRSNVRYISLMDLLNFQSDSIVSKNCLIFHDNDHLSRCGQELFGPTISDALR